MITTEALPFAKFRDVLASVKIKDLPEQDAPSTWLLRSVLVTRLSLWTSGLVLQFSIACYPVTSPFGGEAGEMKLMASDYKSA